MLWETADFHKQIAVFCLGAITVFNWCLTSTFLGLQPKTNRQLLKFDF